MLFWYVVNSGRVQHQAFDRQGVDPRREDAARAERLDERDAVAGFVFGRDVEIGGDQRAQVIAEGDVAGRTVVERANADVEQVLGDLSGLAGEAMHQVAADAALGQHAGSVAGDAQQVARAKRVDALKGVEHGRHQHGAARVRLDVVDVVGRTRFQRDPLLLPALLVLLPAADHAAQRPAVALDRLAELRGELAEHAVAIHPPAAGVELVLHQLAEGEALQERHDVGEAFVERGDIRVRVFHVAVMDRVEDGVRRLVRHDVRAQAGEDQPAGIVGAL